MSVFSVVSADMSAASGAVAEAADGARGHGSSEELSVAAAAVPGSDAASLLPELGDSWDDEVSAWADAAASFGSAISAASDDATATDEAAGGLFGGLFDFSSGGG